MILVWCGCVAWLPAPPAAAAGSVAAPAYRFRQPPDSTLGVPATDLLDSAERDFLARLPVLRVGLNLPDNRPYEVIAASGEISGIQIELLTHVAQALGLRLQPVVLPSFPEALAALRTRDVDVMATVGYAPEREAYMAFTLGTAPNPGAIVGRSADSRFVSAPTLNGHRVAIEQGYVSHYYVQRLYPDALVVDRPDTASALRAVALGEDDYYFGSLLMATDRIQRDGIGGLAIKRSLVYATGQMHFGVRSDWPLLASALSKAVAALRQAPLPELRAALDALSRQGRPVAAPMALAPAEQRQVAGRSVLKVGAVRGLALINEALPGGGHSGIGADFSHEVALRLGTALDVVPFDTEAQMFDALRAGRIHLVPFATRTAERALAMGFSQPYLDMPYLLVARSDAPLFWDLDSLRGRRLALAEQHPLRELLRSRYPDIRVVDASSDEQAMQMVVDGQADAAVEPKLSAHLRINSDPQGRLRPVATVSELPGQVQFAVARELAPLVPLIDRALADIPGAEKDRLLRRWVAVDLEPRFPWRRHLPWMLTAATALLLGVLATLWWMRRLKREVAQRRQAEQRLRDVTRSVPGVVFQYISEPDGRLLQRYFSEGVAAFLGDEVAGAASVFDAVLQRSSAEDVQRLLAARSASLASGAPFKQTCRYDDPRHGLRWLHCEAVSRALPAGRTAWTGVLVDVTGERALQGQLLDAVQAKNLFVASASHELRAPLQVITLALQRLGLGALDDAQRHVWRLANDASDALLLLIDDVLDLARLESGRLRLQPVPVVLATLLAQIVEQHQLAAERGGLRLSLVLAPGLPARLSLDALRLRQLLANLVGNAIKYTPAGEVTVAAAMADAGTGLRLTVRDTGIGIDADRQHALFEPFETLHTPGQPVADRSTGLGLAICKRLVDAMGGQVSLRSSPGQGTEVQVWLPMTAVAADTAPAGALLLVDDDPVSRLLMATLLRSEGFLVEEAADAQAALALWRGMPLAAVISDRHMAGTDGPALLAAIRREAQASGRPLPRCLLCTGDDQFTDPTPPPAIDLVLRKPVQLATLTAALAQLGVLAPLAGGAVLA
jgi:two-component system sensor histidine kinase EvgS